MNKIASIFHKSFFENLSIVRTNILKGRFSNIEENPSKTKKNFFLSRTAYRQFQHKVKLQNSKHYIIQNNPYYDALLDHNLQVLLKQFNEKTMVIFSYHLTQQYKNVKNESLNEKFQKFINLFRQNLKNFKKPHSLYIILFNLNESRFLIPQDQNLEFFKFTLKLLLKNSPNADGKSFSSFLYLYSKVEYKLNFEQDFVLQLFDYFLLHWKMFNIENLFDNFQNFIGSKFAINLCPKILKTLKIYDEISRFLTFSDYEASLKFFKSLLELNINSKYEKLEELKMEIADLMKKIFLITFKKSTKNYQGGEKVLQPINYFFTNKTIILKVYILIKELEKIIQTKEISNLFLISFSKGEIRFEKKEENTLMEYYNQFCSQHVDKEEILNLISYIVFI